jgi:hypothetical protein
MKAIAVDGALVPPFQSRHHTVGGRGISIVFIFFCFGITRRDILQPPNFLKQFRFALRGFVLATSYYPHCSFSTTGERFFGK